MKRVFGVAVLALPLLAGVATAGPVPFGPYKVEAGGNVYFRVTQQPGACGPYNGATCGPWYNYWPLEAHFQKPALGFPYFPSPQGVLKPDAPPHAAAAPVPGAPVAIKPAAYQSSYPAPSHYQPTYPAAQVPSYWYGQ